MSPADPAAAGALAEAHAKFGVVSPFGGPTSSGMLTLHCPPEHVHALATFLRANGAASVSVAALDYVFACENPLMDTLAAAHAEAGDFEQALKFQTKALDAKNLEPNDRSGMEDRLNLYRQRKPYRE